MPSGPRPPGLSSLSPARLVHSGRGDVQRPAVGRRGGHPLSAERGPKPATAPGPNRDRQVVLIAMLKYLMTNEMMSNIVMPGRLADSTERQSIFTPSP